MTTPLPRTSGRPAATQADRLVRHGVYMIATGKWPPGARLPSIRAIRHEWGINQVTVQQAYGRLQEMGLAESRLRSGWFVAGGGTVGHLSRYRHELESLHRDTSAAIRERTDLSVLGVLRYLAELEEIRRVEEPEVAFVECTAEQARGHAEEIAARFRVPVLSMTTGDLGGKRTRVPLRVRTLLTSPFHLEEIRPLADPPGLTVAAVPVEISPGIAAEIGEGRGTIVLLEREASMAEHIASDLTRLVGGARVQVRLAPEPDPVLAELLGKIGARTPSAILLSPRLWGELDAGWRTHPRVHQVAFRITGSGWTRVLDAIGLPVGV